MYTYKQCRWNDWIHQTRLWAECGAHLSDLLLPMGTKSIIQTFHGTRTEIDFGRLTFQIYISDLRSEMEMAGEEYSNVSVNLQGNWNIL